ncbi:MAG: recombinase RecT [Treponemataceae bacterium]|nr:recombinase RecT [Treponemataceae bacterium]
MNELSAINTTNSLMPQTFEERYKMAGVLAKSGLIPAGLNSPEKVCVALQWGLELGLSPMVAVNNIAVVNGKPTLSADIMNAICRHNPEYGGIEWVEQSDKCAELKLTRISANGIKEVTIGRYTIEDARNAGLLVKDNWKKYPVRMLKHRALSYALRDAFPDALAGIYMPEEMENIPADPVNVTPAQMAQQAAKPAPQNKVAPKAPETKPEAVTVSTAYQIAMDIAAALKATYPDGAPVFSNEEVAQLRAQANAAYKASDVGGLLDCFNSIQKMKQDRTVQQEIIF